MPPATISLMDDLPLAIVSGLLGRGVAGALIGGLANLRQQRGAFEPGREARLRSRSWRLAAATMVLILSGCTQGQPVAPARITLALAGPEIELAFGGDVLLGDDMNSYVEQHGPAAPLAGVPELRDADIAVVNLESVVAGAGDAIDPGNLVDYSYRGRPEMLGVLQAAGIDAVLTGSNHGLDYGPAALVEEDQLLRAMGLAHPGTGTRAEACAPVYLEARGIRVALFSVNTTSPNDPATDSEVGTCYVAPGDHAGWEAFRGPIAEARAKANVVLFAPHFLASFSTVPDPAEQNVARLLIDLGVDAVLGNGAHALQGIELYHGRPILHDAGSLLFNFPQPDQAALFLLSLNKAGVTKIRTVPLVTEHDWTRHADPAEAAPILAALGDRSSALGTRLSDGLLELDPEPHEPPTAIPALAPLNPGPAPGPLTEPPANCTVSSVPGRSAISPVGVGPLTLVGFDVTPERLEGPALILVETFWRIDAETQANLLLAPRAVPGHGDAWQGPHEPCDWAWPTSRWKPDVIYRDRYLLRPPPELLRGRGFLALASGVGYGRLALTVGVEDDRQSMGQSSRFGAVELEPSVEARLVLGGGAAAAVLAVVAVVIVWRRRKTKRARRPSADASSP